MSKQETEEINEISLIKEKLLFSIDKYAAIALDMIKGIQSWLMKERESSILEKCKRSMETIEEVTKKSMARYYEKVTKSFYQRSDHKQCDINIKVLKKDITALKKQTESLYKSNDAVMLFVWSLLKKQLEECKQTNSLLQSENLLLLEENMHLKHHQKEHTTESPQKAKEPLKNTLYLRECDPNEKEDSEPHHPFNIGISIPTPQDKVREYNWNKDKRPTFKDPHEQCRATIKQLRDSVLQEQKKKR